MTHDDLTRLACETGKPVERFIAMSKASDPFMADSPSRARDAEWFAGLWTERGFGGGVHLRRIHYRLVTEPPVMPNGKLYENTDACWQKLLQAGRDARYLDLVPRTFVDQRNPEAVCFLEKPEASRTTISQGERFARSDNYKNPEKLPRLPELAISDPVIPQRYHIELWAEKSTQNDILQRLATSYRLNLFAGAGEVSLTRCDELIERAKASHRPIRVLYISDFDPSGENMPVAAARKIEFAIRNGANIDLQVRPIALTFSQCEEYNLPRTPIKPGEKRRDDFEDKYGRGATELDALEALYPGSLRNIVEGEIKRYIDPALNRRLAQKSQEVRARVQELNQAVRAQHQASLDSIQQRHAALAETYNDQVASLNEAYNAGVDALNAELAVLKQQMRDDLLGQPPFALTESYLKVAWPEPAEGDEDPDPMFDSKRDYDAQVQRFKSHRGDLGPNDPVLKIDLVALGLVKPFVRRF